jgi:threonine aldolase
MSPVTESPVSGAVSAGSRKSFGSDNHAGVHPEVMRAILQANSGDAVAYGGDQWTEEALGRLSTLFGGSAQAFLVLNGSGANVLGLGLMLRRHEAVICASSAHIATDECGSAERILGTKLLTVPTPDGKLTPELIATQLTGRGNDHRAQPGAVAITQSTELGTCYSLDELAAVSSFCQENGLLVYLDGARLANAAAQLNCSLAEIARHADVLSFGATKNGALGAEALIVMRPDLAEAAPYIRKQHMQLASKMRFVAAQFLALLENDLWRANATQANAMASRLAGGLTAIPGVGIAYPVQADAVFARLNEAIIARLQRDWFFHTWDESTSMVRLMTAFDTTEADVDAFVAAAQAVTSASS